MNSIAAFNTILEIPKSVQEVSKNILLEQLSSNRKTEGRHRDKSHVDYWKSRLFYNTYQKDGKVIQCSALAVKIQYRGKRETFTLKSKVREMAAREAKDIYTFAQANGMPAAVAKFKPEVAERIDSPTVAQFLTEICTKSGLKARTFNAYANSLRKIVADVFMIDGSAKFDQYAGGHAKWLGQINGTRLNALTPDKIQAWKVAYVAKAAENPIRLAKAKRSVNSLIRRAKSLFAPRVTKFLAGVILPSPLPFTGIAFEKAGSTRYKSMIDPNVLVTAARTELAKDHPEQFKIFLLGIGAGLRKAEIDTLTWSQIDWKNATVWIGPTKHFTPKTTDSQGTVDVDSELIDILKRAEETSQSEFVINSPLPAKPNSPHPYYRCEKEFDELNDWLRSKGITAQKPLHELRKEFGSLVCQQAGIFAASTQLRHGDIRVTASFYVAKKERVTVKLGGLLNSPN